MNYLFGAIAFMFVLFVAAKGTLPKYLSFLVFTPGAASGTSTDTGGSAKGPDIPFNILKPLGFDPLGIGNAK